MSDQEHKVVRLDSLFTQDFVDECDKHYRLTKHLVHGIEKLSDQITILMLARGEDNQLVQKLQDALNEFNEARKALESL